MRLLFAVLLVTILVPGIGSAQEESQPAAVPAQAPEPTGPAAFVQFLGSATPLGTVMVSNLNLGYDLTPHIGFDAGLPVFSVRSPFSLVTNHDWRWSDLWGDPYLDARYTTTRYGFKVNSILTVTFPGSTDLRIFTTGRVGGDWYNHLEHGSYWRFTPFVNFGAANGTIDRYVTPRPYEIARPYRTLGLTSDFEGGTNLRLVRGFRLGGSAYGLVPAGPQKVFSRLVAPDNPLASDGNHNRYFDAAFETIGPSKIARDNGVSGWLEITRFRNFTLQFGYTRSGHYAYDAYTFMLRFDGTSLIRGFLQ